ncbi:hypothetical protein A3D77_04420 [Candidatus Gottesmanbacteria bacterium RIFCSPHIGHO2_02_FULL_39_11]|uniref:Methyltransferase domain-containing protein n=1 Tax=Candidatus Gottesmanbacteria bacterium RIFCSPHIGHO2_02_FULL_39_11 TaxID=1798382 RepID=A0A1F5ZJA1_9BACT|nr:MAG: hypothetical protein A3D77_04420 [Candidatus Gottesmanbacteria bacterium RIFCSPHIGHO2_02_FULL_39_11]
MSSQQKYWDNKIKIWSDSSYRRRNGQFNLIEYIAGFFRGPINGRLLIAYKFLCPLVKDKILADFGCGTGEFCFRILRCKPQRIIGMDISSVAVKEASRKAASQGISKNLFFIQKDIAKSNLPYFNYAVGLGFIDYLSEEELKLLFKKLKGKKFFFSFPEKKLSLINFFHLIYLKLQNCPGAYKYSKEEFKRIIPADMPYHFYEEDRMQFLTNL